MLRFEYRMKLFAIKNLRFKHHFTLPQDKALPLSIAVFVFISFSTIVTLNQVQKRQITESQAQASIDNQPGGACDLSVNKGCGGAGGCRHWEYCNESSTCIDTTSGGTQPASSNACGNAAFAPAQSTPAPHVTQGSNPTSVPAQTPATGSCEDVNWYCLGECASQEVRNFFGGNATQWRKEKAINERQPGACDRVATQPTQSPSAPIQHSETPCYTRFNGQVATYPAGYCSPTSAGNPYLFCNNTASATPSTSNNSFIGWVSDDETHTTCIVETSRCIGNGFAPSGGFNCCSGKTDVSGKCTFESQTTVLPTSTLIPIQSTITVNPTVTPAPSVTPLPSNTPVPVTSEPTHSPIPLPTSTSTPSPTITLTPTHTTIAIAPTNTPTSVPTQTATPIPPTNSPVPPTNSPIPTSTLAPLPTSTPFYTSTPAPISTSVPTSQPTQFSTEPVRGMIGFVDGVYSEFKSTHTVTFVPVVYGGISDYFATNYSSLRQLYPQLYDEYADENNPNTRWMVSKNFFAMTKEDVESAWDMCPNDSCMFVDASKPTLSRSLFIHEATHLIQAGNAGRDMPRYMWGNGRVEKNLNIAYRSLEEGYAEYRAFEQGLVSTAEHGFVGGGTYQYYRAFYSSAKIHNLPSFYLARDGHWTAFCDMMEEYKAQTGNSLSGLLQASGWGVGADETETFTAEQCKSF